MTKTFVAIFAHPDDEAFGPGGTLASYAKEHDVYIICATGGEEGKNSLKSNDMRLSDIRKKELRASAKKLGVKKVYFLGFEDGSLCNHLYHDLASKVEKILKKLKPETLLTYEPRGISGHIDHITMSMVTSYLFYRLSFTRTLLYYCMHEKRRKNNKRLDDYFIYFPPGYSDQEINKVVDIKDVFETKIQAMLEHKSQAHDARAILTDLQNQPKEEYFLMVKKS